MLHDFEVQGSVFALLQIFNAIPSRSFSAPAELRILNPTADPYFILIRISDLWNCLAQYILGVRRCRIPSNDGLGRLKLQCRFDTSLYLCLRLNSRHFGTTSSFHIEIQDLSEDSPDIDRGRDLCHNLPSSLR
jgi:hypothetical protein